MTVEGEDSEGYLPCLDEDLQFFEVMRSLLYCTFGAVWMQSEHLSTKHSKWALWISRQYFSIVNSLQ